MIPTYILRCGLPARRIMRQLHHTAPVHAAHHIARAVMHASCVWVPLALGVAGSAVTAGGLSEPMPPIAQAPAASAPLLAAPEIADDMAWAAGMPLDGQTPTAFAPADTPQPVPEPGSVWVLAAAVAGIVLLRRMKESA